MINIFNRSRAPPKPNGHYLIEELLYRKLCNTRAEKTTTNKMKLEIEHEQNCYS